MVRTIEKESKFNVLDSIASKIASIATQGEGVIVSPQSVTYSAANLLK